MKLNRTALRVQFNSKHSPPVSGDGLPPFLKTPSEKIWIILIKIQKEVQYIQQNSKY